MELDNINRAVEMTACCKSVEPYGKIGSPKAWAAVLWCASFSDYVSGYGKDAWAAVQDAHAKCKTGGNKAIGLLRDAA